MPRGKKTDGSPRCTQLWTAEITQWVRERVPLREHGYTSRKQLLEELNAQFGTSFSIRGMAQHVYENHISLGLCYSNSTVPRGESHWRHRAIGELQEKKGYLRIKVAEPNTWIQLQRYVWEQAHPGQSAAGKLVIFLDGNNRNFAVDNLECVTRGELACMSRLGHTQDMTKEERILVLTRARIVMAKSKLAGKDRAQQLYRQAYYQKRKGTEAARQAYERALARLKERYHNDPQYRERVLHKQREWRKKNKRGCYDQKMD